MGEVQEGGDLKDVGMGRKRVTQKGNTFIRDEVRWAHMKMNSHSQSCPGRLLPHPPPTDPSPLSILPPEVWEGVGVRSASSRSAAVSLEEPGNQAPGGRGSTCGDGILVGHY